MSHLDLTFGIELECYIPEDTTRAAVVAAVSRRIGEPVNVEGYNHITRPTWKAVTDGSLGDYNRGIEFVSPVLRGQAGLDQLAEVCRALTDFGCTVSKKCGYHVHVGMQGADLPEWKKLVRLYSMFEAVIDSVMPPSRRGSNNSYCRSLAHLSADTIDRADTFAKLQQAAAGTAGRFSKVNLAARAVHGTVEFRQHSGTLDAEKAVAWATLCLRMVAAARRSDFSLGSSASAAVMNRARPGSRAWRVGQMLLRPEGATGAEVCSAMGWTAVSMPAQAAACGLPVTTQRMGRVVRYFAAAAQAPVTSSVAVTLDGLAALLQLPAGERAYFHRRQVNLSGPIAWAA